MSEATLKIGDKIYQTDGEKIYESKIKNIIFETESVAFDETAIGKAVFLTKVEAEQVLNKLKE